MNYYISLILEAEGAKERLRGLFQSAPEPEKPGCARFSLSEGLALIVERSSKEVVHVEFDASARARLALKRTRLIPTPGHLNPMTTLARQLQARGHEVVFLYSRGGAGLPFVPGPEKGHFNENRPEVSKMQGEDALQFSVRVVLAQTEAILNHCRPLYKQTGSMPF